MKMLFSMDQNAIISAEAQMCKNCGIPDNKGTTRWSNIYQINKGYAIIAPIPGRNVLSKADILKSISRVTEIDYTFPNVSEY